MRPRCWRLPKKRFKPAPALACHAVLMAKKNPAESGDHHEAFQKTDRSVFAGLIVPYLSAYRPPSELPSADRVSSASLRVPSEGPRFLPRLKTRVSSRNFYDHVAGGSHFVSPKPYGLCCFLITRILG